MTDEEMARALLEALGWHKPHHLSDDAKTVLPFLAQVRTETVERCAKVADKHAAMMNKTDPINKSLERARDAARATATYIANDIRGLNGEKAFDD